MLAAMAERDGRCDAGQGPPARARAVCAASRPPGDVAWAALVPELLVEDLERSLRFWCELVGFAVA
ncbi:MAG: hypothetical protein AVDCRST_MAG30-3707 [uncultured Solirubrobacteraceae bacterium]|uniref:Uncharacterized protein n=1 Tax=uncultured Solirubrobacteraceae bacterium TaxID=1162706 RepID=A0A6J4TS00_9ACTN|nr:MAG: hypothetical protein AVDCRST_MAG30-3707 [uncultured Solirubrobacteraceae bacterium]